MSQKGCISLKSIRLGNNMLVGNLPSEIGNLTELEELDIENNRLDGSLPVDTMIKLSKLQKLNLSENNFSGPLPVDLKEQLEKLSDLRLYNNRFDEHTISRFVTMRTVSKPPVLNADKL